MSPPVEMRAREFLAVLIGGPCDGRNVMVKTLTRERRVPQRIVVDKQPYEFFEGYLISARYTYAGWADSDTYL